MSESSGTPLGLSVVIPAFNEEANVEACYRELVPILEALGRPFEVIVVDDGSTDRTFEVLAGLAAADPRLRLIRFRRNAGQTAALDAGFKAARGEVVVTMDADLQNDPRDIPRLLTELGAYDAACGWRVHRRDPWIKRVSSRLANAVRNCMTAEVVHDTGCTLKAYRRECLARLKLYRGMHRFLPTLLRLEGFRVVEVPVNHRPRRGGQSKYSICNRLWAGLADLFVVRWMMKRRLHYEIERVR